MARARIISGVTEVAGEGSQRSVSGATVNIYKRGTVVAPTAYSTETGGTLLTAPFTTDASGRVIDEAANEIWVDPPQSLDIVATKTSGGVTNTYTIAYEALSASELGGRELGYAEITTSFATASTSAVDITGLTTTVTVGTRPVYVTFNADNIRNSTASGAWIVEILEDGVIVAQTRHLVNSAGERIPVMRQIRRAPAAGSHTYKARTYVASGTATLEAGATTPAFISVHEG